MERPTMYTSDHMLARRPSVSSTPEGYHRPRKTPSKASSMFSIFLPAKKDTSQEDRNRIAVYDPLERKLWVDKKDVVEKTGNYVKVPIPGTELKVSVFMEIKSRKGGLNPSEDGQEVTEQNKAKTASSGGRPKVFIAQVDLGRLPQGKSWVKGQRKKNRMQYLYVLGQVPAGFEPIIEEDGVGS